MADARRIAAATLAIALALGPHAIARAHPAAAESPEWQDEGCIQVVDLKEKTEIVLPYGVAFDDTEYQAGDIMLDDAKTHQFFAFRGALAPYLLGSQLFPFDRPIDETLIVPEWIDADDVERAAAASDEQDATNFTADQVLAQEQLQRRADLQPYILPITDKTQRVPIVAAQAALGLRWDLRGAMPGVYQVAGYVFSPPFNAWAPRRGVIVLVDGDRPAPTAITVEPIDGFLFSGQGRPVRGCVHAGASARIEAFFRSEDREGEAWQRFASDVPIEEGRFDLCFSSPDPDLSGVVRVRVDVIAEDGAHSYGYSPDTMVVVGTKAACVENASTCCAAQMPDKPTPMQGGAGAMATAAGAGGTTAAGAAAAAAGTTADNPPADTADTKSGGDGCSAAQSSPFTAPIAPIALVLAGLALIRRRLRRP